MVREILTICNDEDWKNAPDGNDELAVLNDEITEFQLDGNCASVSEVTEAPGEEAIEHLGATEPVPSLALVSRPPYLCDERGWGDCHVSCHSADLEISGGCHCRPL